MIPHFDFGSPTTCTYCGDDANATDHVIAVSYQKSGRRKPSDRHGYGPVTYCCISCNSILSNKWFNGFEERCRHVSTSLNRHATAVQWTNKEIAKVDYSLQGYLEHERNKRLWYRYRADWFQSKDFFLNIEQLRYEPALDRFSPVYNEALADYFRSTLAFIDYSRS